MDAVVDDGTRRGAAGRRAMPAMTRGLAIEIGMGIYGAAMMAWLFAVLLSAPAQGEEASLSGLGVVFLAWGLGTLPAYLVSALAARRWPAA